MKQMWDDVSAGENIDSDDQSDDQSQDQNKQHGFGGNDSDDSDADILVKVSQDK